MESCNLRCRGCSHLSPVLPRSPVDPDRLHDDLSALGSCYHASLIRLLGGEPLLHPDLLAVVEAVRWSGVADRISLQTNGVLLAKASPALWEAVDVVKVTSYPGSELEPSVRKTFDDLAASTSTSFIVDVVDSFRVPYVERPHGHEAVVFAECKIIREWNCHTVADGRFYRCPQSYFLGKVLGTADEGIPIHEPDLERRVRALVASVDPLAACTNCLGTSGPAQRHEQVARSEWRRRQDLPPSFVAVTMGQRSSAT